MICPSHLGCLSWPACGWRCLWLPGGAGRAQVGHVEQILFWMQGAVSPVPSGCENKPQCTSVKPQETLQQHTFLQDPYFLFIVSSNSGSSGIVCGEKKKNRFDFCSSHLPPQTRMYYLVMSLTVVKTLLGWMLGVRSAGHRKFLICVWSSSVKNPLYRL